MPEIIKYIKENDVKSYKKIIKRLCKIRPRIIKQWINNHPNLIYDENDTVCFYDENDYYILKRDKSIIRVKDALLMEFC